MIALLDLQLWLLFQATISALCWRFIGFEGFIGSLIGSFIYISLQ